MQWAFLTAAIVLEVSGTLALRMATTGRRTWFVAVTVGYVGAFAALSAALSEGLGIGEQGQVSRPDRDRRHDTALTEPESRPVTGGQAIGLADHDQFNR